VAEKRAYRTNARKVWSRTKARASATRRRKAARQLLILVAVQIKLEPIEGFFGIRPYELDG
jgi:hypothetical protein